MFIRFVTLVACLVPIVAFGTVISASYKPSEQPIDTSRSFAVVRNPDERDTLGVLICSELARRGIDVELISTEQEKSKTQLLVRYEAVWNFINISWHPIAIGINIFEDDARYLVAGEATYRDALSVERTEKTVADLVDRLLGESDKPDETTSTNCQDIALK